MTSTMTILTELLHKISNSPDFLPKKSKIRKFRHTKGFVDDTDYVTPTMVVVKDGTLFYKRIGLATCLNYVRMGQWIEIY